LSLGEPEVPFGEEYAPAIFKLWTTEDGYDYLEQNGGDVSNSEHGGSSAGYSAKYGTLTLITEMAYFDDPRVNDQTVTEIRRRGAILEGLETGKEVNEFVTRQLEAVALDLKASSPFRTAVTSFKDYGKKQYAAPRQWAETDPGTDRPATVAELFSDNQESEFYSLLQLGMLVRLLEVKNLTITYRTDCGYVAAVQDVSFRVPRGGSIELVEESGSGKSTIAMAVMRLLPANAKVSGQIIFDGTDLTQVSDRQLNRPWRWRKPSMVFQKSLPALSPVHRIGDQMHNVLRQHDQSLTESQRRAKTDSVLEAVNLPQRVIRSYPCELSGGIMQRTMIALGLVCNPPFVIFDEATTALDVITQAQILSEVKRLKQEFDLTTMVISHDVGVIKATTDTVAVLYGGRLIDGGRPREAFFTSPQHPYSKALIGSVPILHGPKKRITGISGWRLDLESTSERSQLHDRRPESGPQELEASPMVEVGPGHFVRRSTGAKASEVAS